GAAILRRCFRLEVIHIDMAGPTAEHDINDRLGALRAAPSRLLLQQIRQRQASQTERPGAEKLPPADPVAKSAVFSCDRQHPRFLIVNIGFRGSPSLPSKWPSRTISVVLPFETS